MNEIKTKNGIIKILTSNEIIKLHYTLSSHEDILGLNPEPIVPNGVKSSDLLCKSPYNSYRIKVDKKV